MCADPRIYTFIRRRGSHITLSSFSIHPSQNEAKIMALRCLFGRRSLLVSAKTPQRKLGFCGGGFGGIPVRNQSDDPSVLGKKFHHPLGIHPRPSVSIYRDPEFSNDTFGAGGIKPYYGSLSDPLIIHASESAIRQYNRRQVLIHSLIMCILVYLFLSLINILYIYMYLLVSLHSFTPFIVPRFVEIVTRH